MSNNDESGSHKDSGSHHKESFNIHSPSKNDVTSSRFSNSFEFWLSSLGYAVGYGNIWRFPYMLYRNGGGVFFIPYFTCIFIIILPLSYLEIAYGQLYRHEIHRYYDLINPRLLGLSFGISAVIFFIAMYYMCLIAWCFTYLIFSFQDPLPWAPAEGASIIDSFISDKYFVNDFLGRSEGLFDISGYQPWIAFSFLIVSVITFLIIYEGIDTAKYAVYIIVPLPYVLMTILFIKGIGLEGHTIGWVYLFTPHWSKLFTLQIWADAWSQTLFSAGLAQNTIVKFASHRKEGDPILQSTITIPLMNFATSIFAAFTLFSFVGYASKQTGIPIEDMAIGGMELTFVVYPALLTTLPFPQVWSVLFFTMLVCLGLCTEYIFIECVSKLIYGTIHRHKGSQISPTKVTFIVWWTIFAFNIIFFSSSAGYYWLETVDHYATGVNLVVFLFFQLVVVVYLLPLDELIQKVNNHGEQFPQIYAVWLKIVCPAFSLFLAGMAIAKEIKFPLIEDSFFGKLLSYSIFFLPSILFVGMAIWNPYGKDTKEKISRLQTDKLLKDDDNEGYKEVESNSD